jgi:Leucine-rich repeat (LRR) protein
MQFPCCYGWQVAGVCQAPNLDLVSVDINQYLLVFPSGFNVQNAPLQIIVYRNEIPFQSSTLFQKISFSQLIGSIFILQSTLKL